jgi:hypothetical protein
MRCLLLVSVVSLFAGAALAGPPLIGTFSAGDGRFTESWNGNQGVVGNTIHAQSWDGATLGLEWKLTCPSIVMTPTIVENTVDGTGTGYIKYKTVYDGGELWLSSTGPWGDENYTADLLTLGMTVTSTHVFVFNVLQPGIVSDITLIIYSPSDPECTVPVENTTWGHIKSMYGE